MPNKTAVITRGGIVVSNRNALDAATHVATPAAIQYITWNATWNVTYDVTYDATWNTARVVDDAINRELEHVK
jgi:hypothetical protein